MIAWVSTTINLRCLYWLRTDMDQISEPVAIALPSDYVVKGKPLAEINDVETLKKLVEFLFQRLDDISTVSDIAKGDNETYRRLVEKQTERRSEVIQSDGYTLFVVPGDEPLKEEPEVISTLGTPVSEVTNVIKLQETLSQLYFIIDNVDRVSNIAKFDDRMYKKLVQGHVKNLGTIMTNDGFNLFIK